MAMLNGKMLLDKMYREVFGEAEWPGDILSMKFAILIHSGNGFGIEGFLARYHQRHPIVAWPCRHQTDQSLGYLFMIEFGKKLLILANQLNGILLWLHRNHTRYDTSIRPRDPQAPYWQCPTAAGYRKRLFFSPF